MSALINVGDMIIIQPNTGIYVYPHIYTLFSNRPIGIIKKMIIKNDNDIVDNISIYSSWTIAPEYYHILNDASKLPDNVCLCFSFSCLQKLLMNGRIEVIKCQKN